MIARDALIQEARQRIDGKVICQDYRPHRVWDRLACENCQMPQDWHLIRDLLTLIDQGWQSIETAPQMRKVIVFYVNERGRKRTVMACYYRARSLEMDDDYADVGEYDEASGASFAPEGWYEEHDASNPLMPLGGKPTHWRPLPAPPIPDVQSQDAKCGRCGSNNVRISDEIFGAGPRPWCDACQLPTTETQ